MYMHGTKNTVNENMFLFEAPELGQFYNVKKNNMWLNLLSLGVKTASHIYQNKQKTKRLMSDYTGSSR